MLQSASAISDQSSPRGERWQEPPPENSTSDSVPARTALREAVWMAVAGPYQIACLVLLLAVISTVPIAQLYALGLLLDATARRSQGHRWGLSPQWLQSAGVIVSAAFAVFLFSLPIRLLAHWAHAAQLIDPASDRSTWLRAAALALLVASLVYLGWAWVRGGRLRDYVWPAPRRFAREVLRAGTWRDAPNRVWRCLMELEPDRLFWLGLRGAVATLIWLAFPAAVLIGATRNGQTGLAGLVAVVGALLMGWIALYLPFLQVEFAIDGRFRTMFRVGRVRQLFRRRPLSFVLALSASLLFAVPLYLLKIEATPREVVWLLAILFIVMILPARLITGWVVAQAHGTPDARTWCRLAARWLARAALVPLVLVYLGVLYVSQFTAWEGLSTWFSQHAFLVPVPFAGI